MKNIYLYNSQNLRVVFKVIIRLFKAPAQEGCQAPFFLPGSVSLAASVVSSILATGAFLATEAIPFRADFLSG